MASTAAHPNRWRLLPAVLLGVLIGAGLFTFHFARGSSYLRNDPGACVNCHVMQEPHDAWLKSSHHAVATCNDCHVSHRTIFSALFSKSSSGVRHGVAFTTDEFARPIRLHPGSRKVVEENCVRCHREMVQAVRGAAGDRPCGDEGCARCHGQAGHGAQR